MFFNDDILFRGGPLAVVWRAGNGEFDKKKGRRSREYHAVVISNIATICMNIHQLIGKMGTAEGIPLSKMGTLVKGVGAIYRMKFDKLAMDIFDASLMLRRPVFIADANIDAGPVLKSKGPNKIPTPGPLNVADEFGDLHMSVNGEAIDDRFGMLLDSEDYFAPPRAVPARVSDTVTSALPPPPFSIPSPARSIEGEEGGDRERRKRRREEDNEETIQQQVVQRLRKYCDVNSNAHLLPQDDLVLCPPCDDYQPDLDFGDGTDMLNILNMDMDTGFGADGGMEPEEQPQFSAELLPVEPTTTGMLSPSAAGPPSNLEYDNRSIFQTPPRAGTRPENTIRRRLGHEADETLMQLEDISEGVRARGRLNRPRKRLLIDHEICIPFKDMLNHINAIRTETDMSLLHRRLIETRAPGKQMWQTVPRNAQFLAKAGRVINSTALQVVMDETLRALSKKPEKTQFLEQEGLDDAEHSPRRPQEIAEQQREINGTTDAGVSAGTTGLHGERTAAEMAPAEGDFDHVVMDDGMNQDQPMDFQRSPRAEEYEQEPFLVPQGVPKRPRRMKESVVEDLSRMVQGANDDTFQELFPPGEVSRKNAALGFFMLLKMQAKKEIVLHQAEPFGPITIKKLLRSQ